MECQKLAKMGKELKKESLEVVDKPARSLVYLAARAAPMKAELKRV